MTSKFRKSSNYPATSPLGRVISNTISPINPPSLGGQRYAFYIINKAIRFEEVALVGRKSHIFDEAIVLIKRIESQTGKRLITYRSNNSTEVFNAKFDNFFRENGITREAIVPYHP